MKIKITLSLLLSIIAFQLSAQQLHISGIVTDAATGERLIGASVIIDDTFKGTATDKLGYFALQIEAPTNIKVSYTGYESKTFNVPDNSKKIFNISLSPQATNLGEFEIKSTEDILEQRFNVNTITSKDIDNIPMIGGKPDVIKAAQTLPGINAMNEASSTLIVRGGNPGENSYLFDNVPVIYVNHLGGFMSVFNSDMINSINIYKGGFPAKYGGKLSSIIDITQREGDKNQYKGSLSIGITDVSFAVEGPGGLKNSSFIITGRKTLTDLYYLSISAVMKAADALEYNALYGFHDINGKYSWQKDEKNSFHFNIYQGDDYMTYWMNDKSGRMADVYKANNLSIWGNFLVSGSWNRVVSPKLFASNTVSYSKYRIKNKNNLFTVMDHDTIDYKELGKSAMQDIALQSNWKYSMLKNWNMEFGAQASMQISDPSRYFNYYTGINTISETLYSFNTSLYLDNNIKLFKVVDASVGVRLNNYATSGYNNFSVEPRANINIKLAKNHILNLTYMRATQNAHLLFTSGALLTNEVWVPAAKDIEPSFTDQVSVGWRGEFLDGMLSAEVDVYYKKLHNLATYKEGYTNIIGDGNWRNKIISGGTGTAKGIEFLVKKNKGDFTGFVAYSLSDATRSYNAINNGKEYAFEFSRPHTLSINAAYKFNRKWSASLLWVLNSGLPYTPVLAEQLIPIIDLDTHEVYYESAYLFGEKNSERMKPYHRLDLAAKYSKFNKRGRKVEWTFSVYNAYCQQNPFFYYYDYGDGDFRTIEDDYTLRKFQISFFPIIPSVSYKVYFDKASRQEYTKRKLKVVDGELRVVDVEKKEKKKKR